MGDKANVRELRDADDARILDLWEIVPPAQEKAKEVESHRGSSFGPLTSDPSG